MNDLMRKIKFTLLNPEKVQVIDAVLGIRGRPAIDKPSITHDLPVWILLSKGLTAPKATRFQWPTASNQRYSSRLL